MAIAFVNKASNTATTGSSIGITASPPQGDTIVVGIVWRSQDAAPTAISDNGAAGGSTYTSQGTKTNSAEIQVWTATAVASITTITITIAISHGVDCIAAWYSGASGTGVTNSNTGSTSPLTITLSGMAASTSWGVAFGGVDNAETFGSSTGNLRATQSANSRACAVIDNTGSTSVTDAATINVAAAWAAIAVELTASAAASVFEDDSLRPPQSLSPDLSISVWG